MLCPVCDGEEAVLIETGIRNDPEGQIWRCDCGLEYLDPQPTVDDLSEFYSSEYRAKSGAVMARFLRDMHEASRRMSELDINENTRLLEIGSGSGAFLVTARQVIPNAWGVEPDEESWRFIADMEAITVYKSVGELPEHDRFDLIVMFHVLEHLPDPVGFLNELREKLAKNGKIVVEVPNADDAMLKNKAYRKKYFYQKAHLWYFNWHSLRKVFALAGMDTEMYLIQRYNLRNTLRWTFKRRNNGDGQPGDLKKNWISDMYAKRLMARAKSDTLWAIGG